MAEGEMMDTKPILLVEDNPDDVELTIMALEQSRVTNEVVTVGDGVEALDYLFGTGDFAGRDTSVMPQVILLDLNMPRMNGLEFLRRIRADAKTRLVPVAILTTSNEEKDKVESYELGANSFVRKPVDYAKFAGTIQQLGSYWLELNEVAIKAHG